MSYNGADPAMTPTLRFLLSLALGSAIAGGARADTNGTFRGAATPREPSATSDTSGVAVLKSPAAREVLFRGAEFTMGAAPADVLDALLLCKGEAPGDVCDLPLWRESVMMRDDGGTTLESMLQNELVAHPVSLSPYWLDKRETTVAEYRRCVDAGACSMPPMYASGAGRFDKPDYPIVFVTWDDAQAYCHFRGGRLPTEAEWERAARGMNARRFPWGNVYGRKLANHGALQSDMRLTWQGTVKAGVQAMDGHDGVYELAPVGSFPDGRTPEGLDDMAGNAAEWIADYFEARYDAVSAHDPKGPTTSPFRVVRGGSYAHGAPWMRATARLFATASDRESWIGFRCARDGT